MSTLLRQKTDAALAVIKDAIVELLQSERDGLTNSAIAEKLGLQSEYEGKHKGYLSWSIIGLLLRDRRIHKIGRKYLSGPKPA